MAARELLTTAQLAQGPGLDPEYRLPGVLETLASFLCEREGRYTPAVQLVQEEGEAPGTLHPIQAGL